MPSHAALTAGQTRRAGAVVWLGAGAISAAALVAGSVLALHHPLWPAAAVGGFAVWSLAVARWPALWLSVVPAALPLANLSPWSGWIGFDEFDLLLLATLCGGYGRWAFNRWSGRDANSDLAGASARIAVALGLLLAASSLLGLYRALADAGLALGWDQGYADPLNSLRVCKAPLLALACWPLLHRQLRRDADGAVRQLLLGMLTGLAVVCLAVVWERSAYPGLWDFSARYRATALFWEMHVGGAAIDAFLALTMPFVAWALWAARRPAPWLAAAALALLAAYTCLTSFSRGVYLAVAVPLLALGLVLLVRRMGHRTRAVVVRVASVGGAVLLATALLFVALAAFGVPGLLVAALGMLGGLALARRRMPGWREAATPALALLLVLQVVAVFGTGDFMFSRLAASDRDFGSRLAHWRAGIGLLREPAEWAFGIGIGRLPDHYSRFVEGREFSGAAVRVENVQGQGAVSVSGPKSKPDLAGLYLLSQRVPLQPRVRYRVEFDFHVQQPTDVGISVCEVHLLYDRRCQLAEFRLYPGVQSWQHRSLVLRGPWLSAGSAYAPRRAAFSIAVLNAGGVAEFDNLRLLGAGGTDVLRNGDFDSGLAHWLPVAQYYFLPWHIDNLYLEWLIERGAAGLLLLLVLMGCALWNLVGGPGRHHLAAPFIAASLGGGLIVGSVSSVMDVPRVAFLFLLLVGLALMLGSATSAGGPPATLRCRR